MDKVCKQCKECICKSCEQVAWLEPELNQARAEIDELHLKYAGCKTANNGLQELNAELKAENERLKAENEKLNKMTGIFSARLCEKYRQALQEIKEICKNSHTSASEDFYRTADKIQAKINEVIGAE